MSTPALDRSDDLRREPPDFSLVLGGPLFQLLRRAHLSGDALELLVLRIVIISLLSWLPLLILSIVEGQALRGSRVPFLFDIEVHVRFLIALPLLIAAELIVHERMRLVVRQFRDRNLIPSESQSRFDSAITSALRLRNSVVAELLLIAFVYGFGILYLWRQHLALATQTWYAVPTQDGGLKLSLTGAWYGYVSLPFFQFLLMRWFFRLFVWARFLWQTSRIKLSLLPIHPDRMGGLGFLPVTVYAFAPILIANGCVLAGMFANRIFYLGAKLPDFKVEMAATVILLLFVVLGPLLVFTPQLAAAKRTGAREYGVLAQRYIREFNQKWLHAPATSYDDQLLGSGDIQSLADMGNSFEVIREMRVVCFTMKNMIQLALLTLLPIAPLVLTMIPLEELIERLFKAAF